LQAEPCRCTLGVLSPGAGSTTTSNKPILASLQKQHQLLGNTAPPEGLQNTGLVVGALPPLDNIARQLT
jgi:hypothetical protein